MLPEQTTGLNEATQASLQSVFKAYPDIEKVILYGSRAKGNYKKGSDIDLTIFSKKLDLSDLMKIQNKLDDLLLPYKIDLSLFAEIDNENLKEHIQRVGIIFYQGIDKV